MGGAIWSFHRMDDGTGLPMLAVLGTVTAWYIGDVFYNDYANNHAKLFTADILADAWWQVAWFIIVFLTATPIIHQWVNSKYLRQQSGVMFMFRNGVNQPVIQKQLKLIFLVCAGTWSALFLIALALIKA